MPFIEIQDINPKTVIPGYVARIVKSENMTLVFWEVEEGAQLPEHSHSQEQVANVLEGKFELTLGGQKNLLEPGTVALIPANTPHSGVAISKCRLLDIFYPHRDFEA